MLRNHLRAKFALVALVVLGFIIFQTSSPRTTPVVAPTTLAPTVTTTTVTVTATVTATATVPRTVQTVQTALTPTTPATTVVPTAVEGEVLSRTGTNTVPFLITGVELVLLGTALERNARRRSTLPALTLQPVQTIRITDILREVARARQAAAVAAQARTSDLTPARKEPRTRDIGAWRRYRG